MNVGDGWIAAVGRAKSFTMESLTDRLPAGRSYPLRPSVLERALDAAGVTTPVHLLRWDKFDPALKAVFYEEGAWPGAELANFRVTCRAVPSGRAAEARAAVEAEAIPRLVEWARQIEALDDRSTLRREKPTFRFSLERFCA